MKLNEFLRDTVNLDIDETKRARKSRDWLAGQIAGFQDDSGFPKAYAEYNIHYGSFARKTKIRPLDDIDLMICLSAQGATYYDYGDRITITVNSNTNLKAFCYDYTDTLNSVKVINKFIKKCAHVPQYSKAEIKRNGAAAVLSLQSYAWCFDIVPCFMTTPEWDNRTYYLIPNGSGDWMKTDPRTDRARTSGVNQNRGGNVLNIIRTIKYWNKRPTMPSMSSYLLETMVLNYYACSLSNASEYVDMEIPGVLGYISANIYSYVADPKGIQGNINNLSPDARIKIASRASTDKYRAEAARQLEREGDHKGSIQKWQEVFGSGFPRYE